VRKICPHCRVPFVPTPQILEESALTAEQMKGATLWEGRGCIECNGTGFYGRMAITELLDLSDRIRGLILDKRPAAEIKKAAQAEGMSFLRESAFKKVFAGQTTLREINKVTFVE
jgi:type IV pilus assembly protein PilB